MTGFDLWIQKLSPLVERDHFIQDALRQRGVLYDGYHKDLEKVQLENSQKLRKIIADHGFPTLSNAGENGVKLAWFIIQHSISVPDFMRGCLTEMRLSASIDDYPRDLLAYTEDLIAYLENRPQIYGTHLEWVDGEHRPSVILETHLVDVRRKSMGLSLLSEAMSVTDGQKPPKDPAQKEAEFLIWAKRVGWRI